MKITVQCTSKNERLETDNAIADVTLSPNNQNNAMYATGAAIGTPNTPQNNNQEAAQEQKPEPPAFTLNGALSFTVRDQEEAESFKVGEFYEININVSQKKTVNKDSK